MMKKITYPIERSGQTVERFLRHRGYSRAVLTQLKNTPDGLTVCGERVFTVRQLVAGETLVVCLRETAACSSIVPTPLPLDLVYEDEELLVINKPAGMATHPSQGNRETSLASALAALYAARGEPFVFRAIGRLDKNTSGLVLLAKHALSGCLLSAAAQSRQVRREYLALCEGELPPRGTIAAPIGRSGTSVLLREVQDGGDRAVTHFERLSYAHDLSLARVWLDTGRTHQIRVHMAHIGHPLPGDFLYNPESTLLPRHALHAARLSFPQPLTGEPLAFSAPLPPDMAALLAP